jgi:5-methylcytosine-specific restriction protein A
MAVDVSGWYKTGRWNRLSLRKRRINPRCEKCGTCAEVVHHKKEAALYPDLFWDFENLMSLCRPCHEAIHGRLKK